MFTGNLMSALASAKHHNAVTDEQIGAVANLLIVGIYTIAPIYVAATVVADGQLVPAVLDAIYWFK